LSGLYSKNDGRGDVDKLQRLADLFNNLDPGDNIVVASSFSHMLNLGNLAEEVQIAYRRRVSNAKKGDIGDENSALTESDMEETFRRLKKPLRRFLRHSKTRLWTWSSQHILLNLYAGPSSRSILGKRHDLCFKFAV
jgi:phosphoenolpyruvate carboxylase